MNTKTIALALALAVCTACVDTNLLPNDRTIDEDFWQTKSDVASMVTGAYRSMLDADVMANLIVWGDVRSDELLAVSTISGTIAEDLQEIEAAGTQSDNTFANWQGLYEVINNCNIVLRKAEPVMKIDPNYTQGDYLSDRSQMLALRALCYFYLVRAFRDVPYYSDAYMESSQELYIPQSAPATVLQNCIDDLKEAEANALDGYSFSDWQRTGLITRDAIRAILADIYLWRASITHNEADYQSCADYCDKVLSLWRQNTSDDGTGSKVEGDYPLTQGAQAYRELYVSQNADESLLELQFDGRNNSNTSLCQYFYKYRSSASSGYVQAASNVFGQAGKSAPAFINAADYRYANAVFNPNTSESQLDVRKMISTTPLYSASTAKRDASRDYSRFAQNYILYRMADVMLMRAEALTELAVDNDDERLKEAFSLVECVNSRSLNPSNSADALKWNTYSDKEAMEKLVLAERLREFCFEGKRYYDLMRYNFRHTTAASLDKTLYEWQNEGNAFSANYDEMLTLLTRKYVSAGSSYKAKMRLEPYLYMPIPQHDTKINKLLNQNPVYSDEEEMEKNY